MEPRQPSPAEPITELKRIPIRECGEGLVDYLALCPRLVIDTPRFQYRRETLLRERAAQALCEAESRLPKGYRLGVVEGWRAPHIQRRMYLGIWRRFQERHPDWSDVKLRRIVNRYTAPPDAPKVPPPHSTGGAVDVVLLRQDLTPYDHTSPFYRFDPRGFAMDAQGLSSEAQETRAVLREIFAGTDLTNYPSEYWHWSFGDQGWAYRGGKAAAIYGPVVPTNWSPDPADLVDEPLVLIEE